MRILHFSNKPAFPRIDGGTIAISEVLKALSTNNEVYHFTLSTSKHPFNPLNYSSIAKNLVGLDGRTIDTRISIFGALSALVKNESYHVSRFHSNEIGDQLKKIILEFDPDVVVLESIYLLTYLKIFRVSKAKVVVRTHNVEHQIWEQQSKVASGLKKHYLRLLSKQLRLFELNALKQVDAIIAISEQDTRFFRNQTPKIPIICIPTSFEIVNGISNNSEAFFLGAMDWTPNKDGIQWFIQEVCPLLDTRFSLNLAGKSIQCKDWVHDKIICHGEVPSSSKFIQQHGICLIPLQSGGGIKIKLLENMAHGKAIIATSEGVRGIAATSGKELIIANTPKEFANAIHLLQSNEQLRNQLGEAAQNFVLHNFGIEKISKQILEFIKNI